MPDKTVDPNETKGQSTLARDAVASVVVFLVALPLCMGIAIASGVPPAKGLITGIIGGLVVGFIAGAPLQVSGPAAGLAVIVADLVRDYGIESLGPLLIVAGALQMVAGFLKVGQWFRAMSPAVVYGMLAGIGVLIFASQFHVMVDDKPRQHGWENLLSIPESVQKGMFPFDGSVHEMAAGIGLLTILIIVLWNKFKPKPLAFLPGALLGVATATLLAGALGLPIQRVDVPESLLEAIAVPSMATFSELKDWHMLFAAAALAFVASAETLLSAVAVDQMHTGPRTNYDRELMAQGVGNTLCGVVGGLPMTGVIVRSSANVQAGAQTRLSTILHGAWLLAAVVLLPGLLQQVPIASLAAVLVFTGYKLVDIKQVKRLAQYGRFPVVIYAATVIGIVGVDLLTGVLVGVALSVVKLLYKVTYLGVRLVMSENDTRGDLYLEGAATFLRLPALAAQLDRVPPGTTLHVHLDRLSYIDHSCMELLSNWERQAAERGSRLIVEWAGLEKRFRNEPQMQTTT